MDEVFDEDEAPDAYEIQEYTIGDEGDGDAAEDAKADSGPVQRGVDWRMEREAPPEAMLTKPVTAKPAAGGGGGKPACNTGPKGVLRDYDLAKRAQADIRMREAVQARRETERVTNGHADLLQTAAEAEQLQRQQQQLQQEREQKAKAAKAATATRVKAKEDDEDEDSDALFDDDDDEFFAQYREQKLKAIQTLKDSLPAYRTYKRVSFEELQAIIKAEHDLVPVVVHLYQNHLSTCVELHDAFEHLAPAFPNAHFIRIRSNEAMAKFSDIGLPTIMVYKAGKMINAHLRVHESVGPKITEDSLARFLAKEGYLAEPKGGMEFHIKSMHEQEKQSAAARAPTEK